MVAYDWLSQVQPNRVGSTKTAPKGAVFCRLFTGTETYMVISVPVNYAIRSSGSVTALTARRVWYGVGAPSICQADPSGKVIKP